MKRITITAVCQILLIVVLFCCSSAALAAPETINTSSSATATAGSAQRKTFFDTENETHWAFYYNGAAIEYSYSADGTTWTSAGTLPYNTSSFSAIYKTISGTSYVFVVAEANTYDVVLRRGELDESSIDFDAEITIFNGTSATDLFKSPTTTITENNHLWVSAIKDHGIGKVERFHVTVRRSTNLANGNITAFNAETPVGRRITKLQNAVLVPQSNDNIYLVTSDNENTIVGYMFDGSQWSSANGGETYSWFSFGQGDSYRNINCMAIVGSDLYVGTDGDLATPHSYYHRPLFRFNGAQWSPVGEIVGMVWSGYSSDNISIDALAVIGTDLYLGGRFGKFPGGVYGEAAYIARWDTVNEQWHSVGGGLSGQVRALAVSGTDLYVGGDFQNAGSANGDRIVRWDGAQWNALGTGLSASVRAIAVADEGIYAGGDFLNAGNANGDRIALWDGANWQPLATGLSASVYALAVSDDGLYAGGNFLNAGSANGDRIALWNGASWTALGTGLSNTVYAIAVDDSGVYAGGSFLDAGSANGDRVAFWDGDSWESLTTGISNGTVTALLSSDSGVYIGGGFSDAGGEINTSNVVLWDGGWNPLGRGGIAGRIYSIAVSGTDLYVGGSFLNAGGIAAADKIARWNGNQWFSLGTGLNGDVSEIHVYDNDIYVGGSFTAAGGVVNADRIARWDGSSWNALGNGINNGSVGAIASFEDDLYVGGSFLDAGGVVDADRIARWDGANWNGLSTGIANGAVSAIAVDDSGDVYIGGSFTDAGGDINADRIVRWDGLGWNPLQTGLANEVYEIVTVEDDVYIGGLFTNAGGDPNADYIVRWDGSSWNALGVGTGQVTSMSYSGDNLYVIGWFGSVAGVADTKFIARWDGNSWHAVGSGLEVDSSEVLAIGSEVYVGSDINSPNNTNNWSALLKYGPSIAADANDSTEISATSNSNGDIHLTYTNNNDEVKFRHFDQDDTEWKEAVTLNATASSSPSITYKNSSGLIVASWIESNQVNYTHSLAPYEAADWNAETVLSNIGTNQSVTTVANLENDHLIVAWTNGGGAPYSVFGDLLNTAIPTVAISSTANNPTNSAIPITIQFNKPVTGFTLGEITVGNGTAGSFVAVDGNTYTAEITPTVDGAVTVDVAAAVAQDAFNNDNLAATQFSFTYDSTSPTVAISSNVSSPTNTSPIPVTFQFSEAVSNFTVGDITVGNGVAGSFIAVDGDTYTASITPSAQGIVTVDVSAAVAQDAATNDNTAATQFSITYDSLAPTLEISSTASNPTPTSPIPVRFEFSEAVSGFALSDITVTNATMSDFVAVDSNNFTATLTPVLDGTVSVTVAGAAASDAAGNSSIAKSFSINYQSPDSDNDGVSDATEANDGTNASDSGSFLLPLPTSWCSEWNGFLEMYNVNEYANLSGAKRSIVATLFDSNGAAQSSSGFNINHGQQNDFLVHAMQGWSQDNYGKVCSEVTNGNAGDIDGRMVYYKPNATGYDFAFSLPYSTGLNGSQFVSFNTMQPSLNPLDQQNKVANWIQLTNLETSEQLGSLIFYGENGTVLSSEAVELGAEMRRDFAAHLLGGEGIVGSVEWRPQSSSAKFVLRNTRYFYDNAEMQESFAGAVQIEGMRGNGELLSALLDTRSQVGVLELLNATAYEVVPTVKIYSTSGELLKTAQPTLPGYGSQHLVINNEVPGSELRLVTIHGSSLGSIVATALHYGHDTDHSLTHSYAATAKQALGTELHGSYNTYLAQSCELQLANLSDQTTTSTLSMKRLDGTAILTDQQIELPAKSSRAIALCQEEETDNYGTVTLEVEKNTTQSLLLRSSENGDYRFVVPLR